MINKVLIILTGKSGSGKSIFSDILSKKLNAELIHLDKISHLSLQDNKIKSQLRDKFSDLIFDEKNNINRKALGKIVFEDKDKLNYLNNLCQIFMEDYVDNIILNSTKKYIILEYALLPIMKYFEMKNFKILLTANENIRFERILSRDNITHEYLQIREKNSLDYDFKIFDEIIENNANSVQQLTEIAEKIAKKIQTSIT